LRTSEESGQNSDSVCTVQLVDTAKATVQYRGAEMSTLAMGRWVTNGPKYALNLSIERQKMSSTEMSTVGGVSAVVVQTILNVPI
jgi:hypothetical protein